MHFEFPRVAPGPRALAITLPRAVSGLNVGRAGGHSTIQGDSSSNVSSIGHGEAAQGLEFENSRSAASLSMVYGRPIRRPQRTAILEGGETQWPEESVLPAGRGQR